MRIAAIQHDIVWGDRAANFVHLAPMIAHAAAAGADLVLLSETFSVGFGFGDPGFVTEPVGGPSSQFLAEQAQLHQVWVGGSCPEVADGDSLPANTFVLVGPDGTEHRYRKIHPFSFSGEDQCVRAGTEHVTVTIDGLRLSLFICYDLRFADEFWALAADTDVFLVPANWPASRRAHWTTLLQARAIENQAYVVGVNRVGTGGGLDYVGDSRIIDPFGNVVAAASEIETMLIADVTSDVVADVRNRFRFLQDRR